MGAAAQDVRYAFRALRRNPGFTLVSVFTLALGIGANTAIFSVIDGLLLKPLPYPDSHRLVTLWESNPARGVESEKVSGPDLLDWQQQSHLFESIGFWFGASEFNLETAQQTEKINGAYVSSGLFQTLGFKPLLGRTFLPEEDRWHGSRVALISHQLWESRFDADRNAIGRTITIDTYGRRDYRIVGVMPPGFRFPAECDVWLPTGWMGVRLEERRSAHWHSVIARLGPGVTLRQAQSEMNAIQARIARQHPQDIVGSQVAIVPLLDQMLGRNLRTALVLLWVVVGCVLLIACANLANLLLARGSGRQKEIALRQAVGASRSRIIRQLITESMVLAGVGGAFGVVGASWALTLMTAVAGSRVPRLHQVTIDGVSLAFTLGLSLITGLLFGFAPAWRISKPDLNSMLKDGSKSGSAVFRRTLLRPSLVVFEIALSLILLIGAGLMTRTFVHLLQIDRGFQPDHLLTAKLDFSISGFTTWVEPTSTRPQVTLQQIMERLNGYPGIEGVAAANKLPGDIGGPLTQTVAIENQAPVVAGAYRMADFQGVTPDYFRTMAISLLQGRSFTPADVYEAPAVAIINEAMARRYFPNENPIGKRLALGGRLHPGEPDMDTRDGRPPWKTIVGIAGDTKALGMNAETIPEVYVPYWQWPMQSPVLIVRTSGSAASIAAAIRREVAGVNRKLPQPVIRTMNEVLADWVVQPRYETILLGLFGVTALILVGIGVYGVTSYTIAQRTHEIGIRIAIGARREDVLKLVVGQGIKLIVIGVAIGILSALALTRLIASLLFGVGPTDLSTFVAVSLILVATGLLACYLPAQRAADVDPVVSLRHE